jgi:hypothetical protein
LRLKARARDLGRAALSAAGTGAVCLGLAVIVWSDDPAAWLGIGGAMVALVGGAAARARAAVGLRIVICVVFVFLVRLAGGPAVAGAVAGLLALGWWLRLRGREVLAGLAVYGIAVAALGGAPWRLLAAFGALGAFAVAITRTVSSVRRRWRSALLVPETANATTLGAERR